MSPNQPSANNPGPPSREVYKAARKFLRRYPELAVNFLARECDAVQLLQDACDTYGQKYHKVMSTDSDSDDETKSQLSRRRTLSSNSRSGHASSSSAILGSSGSNDTSSANVIWVSPTDPKPLKARRLSQSDYLIHADKLDRLKLKSKPLSDITWVRYNDCTLPSSGTISVEWAWSSKNLTSEKTQQNTFYVVEDLPGSDVVLGDSNPPDSPQCSNGPSFGHTARAHSYSGSPITELPPALNNHGINLLHVPPTHSYTEDSTASTAKQTLASRVGQIPRERRQSTASEASKIPVRKNSVNSVGSASVGQLRAPGWPAHDSTVKAPPPPLGQAGPTSGHIVTVLCGKIEMGLKLELDASGEIFFESLKRTMKRARREVNRDADHVRFTPHPEGFENCCLVSLMEDQVADDWAHAVNWFGRLPRNAPPKIYAVIGQDDD